MTWGHYKRPQKWVTGVITLLSVPQKQPLRCWFGPSTLYIALHLKAAIQLLKHWYFLWFPGRFLLLEGIFVAWFFVGSPHFLCQTESLFRFGWRDDSTHEDEDGKLHRSESRWLATPKRWRFVRLHTKPIHWSCAIYFPNGIIWTTSPVTPVGGTKYQNGWLCIKDFGG